MADTDFVQSNSAEGGGGADSVSVTLSVAASGADVTAGNTLIASGHADHDVIADMSISDDVDGAYTADEEVDGTNFTNRALVMESQADHTGGATVVTLTATNNPSGDFPVINVAEHEGNLVKQASGGSATANILNTGNPQNQASITTDEATELLVTAVRHSRASTVATITDYTEYTAGGAPHSSDRVSMFRRQVTSTGSYDLDFGGVSSGSADWSIVHVAYVVSGGAPANNPKGPLGHPLRGALAGPIGP